MEQREAIISTTMTTATTTSTTTTTTTTNDNTHNNNDNDNNDTNNNTNNNKPRCRWNQSHKVRVRKPRISESEIHGISPLT